MTELKNNNWQADDLPEADFLSDSAAEIPFGRVAGDIPPPPVDMDYISEAGGVSAPPAAER